MKNFFEFFGFLSTACLSGLLVFTFIGKKEGRDKGITRDERLVSAYSTAAIEGEESLPAPRSITGKKARKDESDYAFTAAGGYGSKKAKKVMETPIIESEPEMSEADMLRALPSESNFIRSMVKRWKNPVASIADEYNVRPQVLLAHAIVASRLNEGYNGADLERDAARHGGERVGSVANALKKYKYGWTMQRLIEAHDLGGHFPENTPVVSASVVRPVKAAPSKAAPSSKPVAPKAAPIEDGFRQMVAKDYGFSNWAGLQRLGDPETKASAQKRVKSLIAAARIR
jgi:hypothetical protein